MIIIIISIMIITIIIIIIIIRLKRAIQDFCFDTVSLLPCPANCL